MNIFIVGSLSTASSSGLAVPCGYCWLQKLWAPLCIPPCRSREGSGVFPWVPFWGKRKAFLKASGVFPLVAHLLGLPHRVMLNSVAKGKNAVPLFLTSETLGGLLTVGTSGLPGFRFSGPGVRPENLQFQPVSCCSGHHRWKSLTETVQLLPARQRAAFWKYTQDPDLSFVSKPTSHTSYLNLGVTNEQEIPFDLGCSSRSYLLRGSLFI